MFFYLSLKEIKISEFEKFKILFYFFKVSKIHQFFNNLKIGLWISYN